MEWNGCCTQWHLTRAASAVLWLYGYYRGGGGYARQPQQLHNQHALPYHLSFLLLCCFSSAACSVTFALFLLRCLWGLLQVTSTQHCHIDNPRHFTFRTQWFQPTSASLYQLLLYLHWEHGCETDKKYTCIFQFIIMRLLLIFTVRRTNTYIQFWPLF